MEFFSPSPAYLFEQNASISTGSVKKMFVDEKLTFFMKLWLYVCDKNPENDAHLNTSGSEYIPKLRRQLTPDPFL